MSSIDRKKNKKKEGQLHVQFAENEDIFILPPEEDEQDVLEAGDLTLAISDLEVNEEEGALEEEEMSCTEESDDEEDDDEEEGDDEDEEDETEVEEEEEEDDGEVDDEDDKTQYNFGDVFLKNQSRMRDAIHYWSSTPYGSLLEDAVEEEGEAEGVQKYITTFVRIEENDDSPRGLERQICFRHNEARKALIENAMHTVLMHDFRLRYQEKSLSDDEVWKELRTISKKLSRGAHAFARKMGKADEAAIHRGPVGTKVVQEHLEEVKERRRTAGRRSSVATTDTASSSSAAGGTTTVSKKRHSDKHSKKSKSGERSSVKRTSSSRDKKDKSDKKERRTPRRISSMSLKRKSSATSSATDSTKDKKDKKDKTSKKKQVNGVDLLIHDVDKRGKTKTASRWKNLKKRLSASSHNKRTQ